MSLGITVAANPERGVFNDPEPLGGSLFPRPFIYINNFTDMSQGITVAANPERGIGNDPEPLGVAFLQGLSCTSMISLILFQLFTPEIRDLVSLTVLN